MDDFSWEFPEAIGNLKDEPGCPALVFGAREARTFEEEL